MELKVWVDGIQRVVCGANYSTTCQDVVLALAHAMGRTGRFTLVEKWRETERPLTPGECPLQALHKWGEYAGEVKFYLVQAEGEKVSQKSQNNWHDKTADKMDKFSHNFSPTPQSRAQVQPSSETIKRSSTFSGAHSPNYALPPSSSHSLMPGMNQTKLQQPHQNQRPCPPRQSSSQHKHQNQLQTLPEHAPSKARSKSQTRQQQRQQPHSTSPYPFSLHPMYHLQNGETLPFSSPSSENSSPRSSSQSTTRNIAPYSNTQPATSVPSSHSSRPRRSHQATLPDERQSRSGRSLDRNYQRGRQPSQNSQQYHQHPMPSQPPSSFPTPAPRGQRHRTSPASPSQQYENLPPVRQSHDSLPPGQSLSTFQVQRPRRSSSSGRRSSNDEHFQQQPSPRNIIHSSRESHVVGAPPELNPRVVPEGQPDFVSSRRSPRKDAAGVNEPLNNGSRNSVFISQPVQVDRESRDPGNYPPNDAKSRSFSADFLSPQPSQGMPIRSVNQRPPDSQPWAKSSASAPLSNTLERAKRSQGDKVSFVESAYLRQQRSSREGQVVGSSSSSVPGQQGDKRRDIRTDHVTEPNDFADIRFSGQDGFQGASKNNMSSHIPALPGTSQPHHQPYDPTLPSVSQPSNLLSSPRRHSAFKEVSPRSSRPSSSSSPAGEMAGTAPVAYNLDDKNFDHYPGPNSRLSGSTPDPNARSHSRQASLEIEEYDLDQNFPDVFAKETLSGPRGPSNNGHGQAHTEYVMDRQAPSTSEMDPEYMHLLRKVNMQQERIRMVVAQTNEISTEIDALEVEESNLNGKLDVVMAELETLGKTEESYKIEMADLERVEWVNVVDGELKCEQDLKKQMTSLKDGLSKVELQLEDIKKEEASKIEEITEEEKRVNEEKAKAEAEEEELQAQKVKAEKALKESDDMLTKRKQELDELLSQIADMEKQLNDQETEATRLESDLHEENLKDFHAHPVPKEPVPSPISAIPDLLEKPPSSPSTPASDTGEAILKILEEGRSPRLSPAMDEAGGFPSSQHLYKSAMAAKNPNGVWV